MRQADVDAIVQARARLVQQRGLTPEAALAALKTVAGAQRTTIAAAAHSVLAS